MKQLTKHIIFLLIIFMGMPATCFAEYFSYNASYHVCFTPENNCASQIIKTILGAKKQILIQAYKFTDTSIAKALVKAKKNGVEVVVILDRNQLKERYAAITLLKRNKIKLIIDYLPEIAHNKIIIIDELIVISGSYNYTRSAAQKNVENVIIIKDAGFAQKYIENWHTREQKSIALDKL